MDEDIVAMLAITVTEDDVAHTTIRCGAHRTFEEVLKALRICEQEIVGQIERRKNCPFYKESLK